MIPDLDAILDEIDALAGPEFIRPTDVTLDMLQDRWGLSDSACLKRAQKFLVDTGRYITLEVHDPAVQRRRRIWRKCRGDDGDEGAGGGVG